MAIVSLALATAWLVPIPAWAQDGPQTPALTPDEVEAHDMSLDLAFACSPRRHSRAVGSESTIQRDSDPLAGTAVFFRSAEGTFLVLEEYDEEFAGHCMVLGWFGGPLQPGRYPIRQLSYDTMEQEVDADRHSFFGMSAVRDSDENSVMVTVSGTVDLTTVDPGRITGSFDLTGFVLQGSDRTDGVVWTGTFVALEGEA